MFGIGRIIVWIIACLAGMIIFFGPTDNWLWDPSYYYAQIRSPIIENNLDFRNETLTNGFATGVTETGLQASPWPIGPGILWSPFFLVAHAIVLLVDPAKATGFSVPYIVLVSFGSVLYGILALLAIYRICRYFGSKYISIMAVLLCLGATSLFYYIFRQPIMAHTTGLLASAIMVLFYIHLTENQFLRNRSGFLFGVILGLIFITRWLGVIFAILPIIYFLHQIIKSIRVKNFTELRFILQQIFVMIIAFIVTISPQLVLWYRLHGKILLLPQNYDSFVANILPINTLNIFFDTNRGLLFWSPFVLIGMIGIARIPNLEIRVSAILCVLLQVVLIGYRVDWYSGGGYGARYFIELLPILVVGFVCLVQRHSEKSAGKVIITLCAIVLIVHQSVLLYAIEHASATWINIQNYFNGQPLGLAWQLTDFLRLVENPRLWLAPRLYVAQHRQTILSNYMEGIQDFGAYLIPGIATVLMPIALIVFAIIRKYVVSSHIPIMFMGVVAYMVAWSVYLMIVG
jgi:hypothetical protein